MSLQDLERTIPHTLYQPSEDRIPSHLADVETQTGFLSTSHEEDYLLRMDAKLGDQWALSQTRPPTPPTITTMTPREVERDVELRNPMSVHNWLKTHKTDLNEADDKSSEAGGGNGRKSGGAAGAARNLAKRVGDRAVERARDTHEGGSPRGSIRGGGADGVPDGDDDIVSVEGGGSADNSGNGSAKKKSRDDDHAYRPKGGRSSAKSKRKREDGEGGGRKKVKTEQDADPTAPSVGPAPDAGADLNPLTSA